MSNLTVRIEYSKIDLWVPAGQHASKISPKANFTMVVYADSSQCSPCFINGLRNWERLNPNELKAKYKTNVVFIIEPLKDKGEQVKEELIKSHFKYPVLIDTHYCFRNANKELPNQPIYHNFLLNKENKIILVGDPSKNENIEKLFYDFISKRRKYK